MIYRGTMRPIYVQIRDILVREIELGKLSPGDSIPSERNLAEMFGVSRVTIRKCIGNMVDEGYLIKNKGKPTIVADPNENHPLAKLLGVAEELSATGKDVEIRVLQERYVDITEEIKSYLQVNDDKKMYEFSRLILKRQEPLVVNYSYVSSGIGKLVETLDLKSDKVFAYLENCGYRVSYAKQEISAGLCEQREAELLKYQVGSPVLIINRITYLDTGDPILYEKSFYRGDIYKYNIKLLRNRRL